MKIFEREPKRFFSFGCSFTQYWWPTWANIIALDLDVPFYNYGRPGVGNQFIFNAVMQADNYFQFDNNDLVIVQWTNTAREDRWIDGCWQALGNIYTQESNYYDSNFVRKYVNNINSELHDFAVIKAVYEFLTSKKCQFHFLKMVDFEQEDQFKTEKYNPDVINKLISSQYQQYLDFILPSFYAILWNDSVEVRRNKDRNIHKNFIDGHPDVMEHSIFLNTVFDEHNFKDKTVKTVSGYHEKITKQLSLQTERYVKMLGSGLPIWRMLTDDFHFNQSEQIEMI